VLAYSSVSQMGFLAAVLGSALAAGDTSASTAAAFYAVHHILVKGGLFLAIGASAAIASRRLWLVLLPAAVLALGLGGLPLTGGALAKLAVKAPLGDGIAGAFAMLSAIGSSLLMLHFLHRLALNGAREAVSTAWAGLILPWLAIAVAAVLVPWGLYWGLYPDIGHASWHDALASKELWAALWPVLVGALLSIALLRWGHSLPLIPEGDVLVVEERAAARAFRRLAAAMQQIDWHLRQWPVAGTVFLVLTIVLIGTLLAGR
jgi:formate hydrogenlyase subunit 3/multisubunit Na+/H+ antiporter MnhD subunit